MILGQFGNTAWFCRVGGPFRVKSYRNGQSTPMSAFPPIATELRTSLEVRFVPTSDSCSVAYYVHVLHERLLGGQAYTHCSRNRSMGPADTTHSLGFPHMLPAAGPDSLASLARVSN